MSERHEADRLDGGAVARLATVALAVLLCVFAASFAYWHHLFPPLPMATAAPPPQPRLQTHAPADLAQLRAAQRAQLERYAWVDSSHDKAQVPVERAMQLLAQQNRALDAPEPQP